MIPFPFNENRFPFFVAERLLVGQLCTNAKSERSLLSCLKLTQCSMSEIGDAPLYNSTDPSYYNRTIASTLKMQIQPVQCLRAQLNASDDSLEVVERKDTARKTRSKDFIEKVKTIIDETSQRPIRQIARDLGVSQTTVNACVKEDLKCRSYRRQTSQILTEKTMNLRLIKSIRPLLPRPEPTGLLRLVIRQEHHQHDPPQHQSQPGRRHPPSIRLAPAGAYGKGMLLVPDPYRGGD